MSEAPEPILPPESRGEAPGRGRLTGRRVLVVGGGQRVLDEKGDPVGNGRAISILCAREGARVAVADMNLDAAKATAERIAGEGRFAHGICANIAEPAEVERMISEATAALGGLDGLALNVGIGGAQGLAASTPDDWDAVLRVNLRGPMLCCRAAFPALSDGASVVFISSVAGLMVGSRMPAYDSSKAALSGLMRHVALEGASRRVRSNIVAPGLMDTPLGRLASQGRPSRATTKIPLGRQGTGWETAHAALFLLSDESAYITGQIMAVDGGLSGVA